LIQRPNADEYAPFYTDYIAHVPDGDVLQFLQQQRSQFADLLRNVSDEQAQERPAPGEWHIKEVIGHLIDSERVFSYRALRFARKDTTPIPGFDQEHFIRESNFSERSLSDLLEEFDHVRAANILMYKSFPSDVLTWCGTANNNPVSVRALVYITAGHADVHYVSLRTVYLKLD
jgi:hypothetical protein